MNMRSYKCCKPISLDSKNIEKTAKLLKLLSEPNRLRILCVLGNGEEHCVCEFEDHLPDTSQSLLSHHLADLKEAELVVSEKRGQRVYYTITESGGNITNHIFNLKEGKK